MGGRAVPVRVLYLQSFKRTGGAERALLGLADAIREAGVEPLVVWPRRDRGFTWLQSRGIRAGAVNVPSWRHGLSLPLLPLVLARLRRIFPPEGVDLVHTNNYRSAPFGRMVSRWAKVPFVCHVREVITPEKIRQYRLRSPDALIAVSEAVSHALVGGGMPLNRITIVHSGVGLPVAAREEDSGALRQGLGILPNDPVVGIVAHI
ncbi:MAG: glycosyltransferase, partial [Candidatus Methylomirabilis sp.]